MTRNRLTALLMLLAFWAVLVAKAAFARFLVFDTVDPGATVLLEGPVLLGVLLLVDAFFADHRFKALVIADVALSFLMASTVLYAGFYGAIPTADALLVVRQTLTVGQSIVSLLAPVYLIFFADIVAIVVYMAVKAWRRRRADSVAGEVADYEFQHRFVYVAMIPAIALLVVSVLWVRALPQPVDSMAAAKKRGVLAFEIASLVPHSNELKTAVNVGDPLAVQASIDLARGSRVASRTVDFQPGAYKGKNLIVIQVEALQSAAMNRVIEGQEVTPNLDRLARESWYYPNAVSETGRGTTADAEFTSNTSLYPNLSAPSSIVYVDRELPSLPRLLGAEGYTTATFHTNTAKYWNREQLYKALGFEYFFDKAYFGDEDQIMFGASDEVLFAKTLQRLKQFHEGDKPFYAQVITMSSHHPYDAIPPDRVDLKLGAPYEGTLTGHYLQSIRYTDRAIGEFMKQLEESGLAEDSIIVIYGDHTGLPQKPDSPDDLAARQALLGGTYTPFEETRVPMIIHLPGQTRGQTVTAPFGQVDIVPTLADALGVDLSRTPHFGRSAFTDASILMPSSGFMPPGTYVDEKTMFVPSTTFADGRAYALPRGTPTDLDAAERKKWEAMRQLMILSEAYVRGLPALPGYNPNQQYILPEGKL